MNFIYIFFAKNILSWEKYFFLKKIYFFGGKKYFFLLSGKFFRRISGK